MCTDPGSDTKLMSECLFSKLIESKADITVNNFDTPRKFWMAALKAQDGSEVFIECSREFPMTLSCKVDMRSRSPYRTCVGW